MQERVTYQIGDLLQAYDGRVGTVVYTHKGADTLFPNEQRVWIQCPNGRIMDATAEYFKAVSHRSASRFD